MTLAEIIDRVLDNVGKADAGEEAARTRIKRDIGEIISTDVPEIAGGLLYRGTTTLTVGKPSFEYEPRIRQWYSNDIDDFGRYPMPELMRSFDGVVLESGNESQQIYEIYNPASRDIFWASYGHFNTTNKAKPQAILVEGKHLTFRPIPDQEYTIRLSGQMIWNVDQIMVATETQLRLPARELDALCVAGATVLEAARRRNSEVIAVWEPIWQGRQAALKEQAVTQYREPTALPFDYS